MQLQRYLFFQTLDEYFKHQKKLTLFFLEKKKDSKNHQIQVLLTFNIPTYNIFSKLITYMRFI